IITFRLSANGESETEAEQVAVEPEQKIRQVLGDDIFGVDGQSLPQAVIELLKQRCAGLVLAESCTGGMVASMIVDVAGSSAVLKEGVVTYANESKINRLGVDPEILRTYGAVSPECCAAMAEGALKTSKFSAPLYSLATTGVAGPDGGTEEKPVGTVWIACSRLNPDGTGTTRLLHYKTLSTRNSIRMRAANAALDLLRRTLLGLEGEFPVIDSIWKLS
ncbi:MAG: nicotinamide-nucleotide amidohydrolase family protein, partial [Planctomycetes bacterium]|nr:nicotinamide-nucleotide amidohydrolase family protein [Planctomycetota bacterium]